MKERNRTNTDVEADTCEGKKYVELKRRETGLEYEAWKDHRKTNKMKNEEKELK